MAKPSDEPPGPPPSPPAGQPPEVHEHPLIKGMHEHPSKPPGAVVLHGYPGRTPRAEYVRLYLGLDFKAYVEFPKTAVLDSRPSDPAVPTSPTRVTVASNTKLEVIQVEVVEASFFQGTISSTYPIGTPKPGGVSTTAGVCNPTHPTPLHLVSPTKNTDVHIVVIFGKQPTQVGWCGDRPTHDTSEHGNPGGGN